MFKDDDEDEENTFGVTRYPCMPSLVALQQMRNRLHLAYLGRKLMKWTALATGRELRRLAVELYDAYEGFGEDMRNAFIMLARARYFCPQLNYIVTEDVCKKAGVLVQQNSKSVSGVRIVQFEIFETEYPPYAHLGIEKGGQAILEAKKAWLELLKRLIMMMQLRSSFLMVELANKNATKKMNVLAKIVIPKTNVTMGYINNELEEYAREEFFRLKKVLEIKRKMYGGLNDDKKKPAKKDPEDCIASACRDIDIVKLEPCLCKKNEVIDKKLTHESDVTPQTSSQSENHKLREEIDDLINQITEVVNKTTDMDEKGVLNASVDDFLKTAKMLKLKLGQNTKETVEEKEKFDSQSQPSNFSLVDSIDINKLCEACTEKYRKQDDKIIQHSPMSDEEQEDFESTASDYSKSELSTIKTEVKEITKITKTVNEDGSITIIKKEIKIENEVKTPTRSKLSSSRTSANKSNFTSASSSQSGPYSGSRTIGLLTFKTSETKEKLSKCFIQRKVKSEILNTFPPMLDPIERFCVSSITLLSTDLDFEYKSDIHQNNNIKFSNLYNLSNTDG